jgi:hypothetical protein
MLHSLALPVLGHFSFRYPTFLGVLGFFVRSRETPALSVSGVNPVASAELLAAAGICPRWLNRELSGQ